FMAVLAWRGKMGWGDVKLMGAAGVVFGYPLALTALIFTSLAGALQAVVTLLWQGRFWETLSNWGRRWAVRARLLPKETKLGPARHIPYGVAIAVGCVWAMWWDRSGGLAQ
ncbi:MAG: prepilin peptidase, partial [Myxococcaceae bacterium]|nr:prepilin peptidase [Myxococcaceae bacterium]